MASFFEIDDCRKLITLDNYVVEKDVTVNKRHREILRDTFLQVISLLG
jgi:hypothetical protein